MESPWGPQTCRFKSLLLSASVLALWIPQGSGGALYIQKIPEHPQKNQDFLLSVQGFPEAFQVFNWYLGKEAVGSTMLFSYFPGLQRPQRDGSAMKHRHIVGFPNGSMLLFSAQPNDSGTYHVTVTMNPDWTMKATTQVQVADRLEKHKKPSTGRLPKAAIIIGALAAGSFLIGGSIYLIVTRGCRTPSTPGQNHRTTAAEKPELNPGHDADYDNIYEVMPSPALLVSPFNDMGAMNTAVPPPLPMSLPSEPQNHHYQDLLNPDPAPYCQLVPTPEGFRSLHLPGAPRTGRKVTEERQED